KMREDMWELFLLNSRTPHYGEGDLLAQMASCNRGIRRVAELYRKHGAERMRLYIDRMLDATEARMRARIRAVLAEGVYSAQDFLDEDGITGTPVRFAVTLTVRDGHVTFDCSECAAQVGSGKN